MAEEPGVAGLGQVFAEFALLPDLLQASAPGAGANGDWTVVLEAHGFNDGHVHPGDLGDVQRDGLAALMARDAKRMCERLRLLDSEGLTDAGRRVAEAAAVPILERASAAEHAAAAVVGDQIRRHYLGADGLELVPLVQQSSARLAAEQQPSWAVLPGLLLAEFDTVLYRGLTDAARARDVAGELPRVRAEVVERLERGDLQPGDYGPGTFADALAFWHYEQDALAAPSTLSLTELRVTAMALTWSGLLREEFGGFEVSVLAPVPEAA
ncbi:MAG: hypothetical protein OXG71_09450 [Rhodospirillales bacterium]|nr:hypothetical protein [Rhodospirillales bacterium]